jgi:hypothetical protein
MFQIRKMDLEARSLQPNVKAVLLAKLREYKSDLNNLKTEVKRIVSGNLNAAARDELLESGMADTLTVCLKLHSFHMLIVVNCHGDSLSVSGFLMWWPSKLLGLGIQAA